MKLRHVSVRCGSVCDFVLIICFVFTMANKKKLIFSMKYFSLYLRLFCNCVVHTATAGRDFHSLLTFSHCFCANCTLFSFAGVYAVDSFCVSVPIREYMKRKWFFFCRKRNLHFFVTNNFYFLYFITIGSMFLNPRKRFDYYFYYFVLSRSPKI